MERGIGELDRNLRLLINLEQNDDIIDEALRELVEEWDDDTKPNWKDIKINIRI